jgi:hypothetical protein
LGVTEIFLEGGDNFGGDFEVVFVYFEPLWSDLFAVLAVHE